MRVIPSAARDLHFATCSFLAQLTLRSAATNGLRITLWQTFFTSL